MPLQEYESIQQLPPREQRMVVAALTERKVRLDTFQIARLGFKGLSHPDCRDSRGRFQQRLIVWGTNYTITFLYSCRGSWEAFEWTAERFLEE